MDGCRVEGQNLSVEAHAPNYRDLRVWQEAMELVPEVYGLIQRLPKIETFAMADQMRRAAVSIPANIAEGQSRRHAREFLQHVSIVRGSLAELETLLLLAARLGYIASEEMSPVGERLIQLRFGLYALSAALGRKIRSAA